MATLRFGKFRGYDVCDVPSNYLVWLLENASNLDPTLADSIRDELADRLGIQQQHEPPRSFQRLAAATPPPEIADAVADIVARGYRALSKVAHPDCGGSHQAMIAATAARDWIVKTFREGARRA